VQAVTLAAVLATTLSLAGCSVQKTASGWFGGERPAATSGARAGRVYYASVAGLTVYSEPSSSSKVVGELSLHEKVTRYKLQGGYAYVTADASGLTGWVNNGMLLWRLPAATPAAAEPGARAPAAPAVEEQGEAPEVPTAPTSQEPSPTPLDTPEAEETPRPRKTGPALFDPY